MQLVPKLAKTTAALWNAVQPGAFEKDGELDKADFKQLVKRRFHNNWLRDKTLVNLPSHNKVTKIQVGQAHKRPWADLSQTFISLWSTSDHFCGLAKTYFIFTRDYNHTARFTLCTQVPTASSFAIDENAVLLNSGA